MRKVYNIKERQTNNEKIKGIQEKQIQHRKEKKTTKTLYSPECLNMPKGYDILVGTRLNSPLLSWEWEEGHISTFTGGKKEIGSFKILFKLHLLNEKKSYKKKH